MEPLILFRTGFFGAPPSLAGLSEQDQAFFTSDQDRLPEATVVVFHIPDFSRRLHEDTPKYTGQSWVAWSMESTVNYPRLVDHAFMRVFDLRMTYERSSDIWNPYLPAPEAWWEAARLRRSEKRDDAQVVMFQSAAIDRSGRNAFASNLMARLPVHSYGRHLNNRQFTGPDLGRLSKLQTIRRYRFCLALENSVAPDYVTEKIFDPLMVGTVPIYRGAPNVADFAPPGSWIDGNLFKDPRELADYIGFLARTPAEYEKYFAWQARGPGDIPIFGDRMPPSEPFKVLLELVKGRQAGKRPRRRGMPHYPFGLLRAVQARVYRAVRGDKR
ncbi:MAG: glycosyltransferase family 10 [Alphaproteobacteria bacterium]